jgi:hypothetical protein
VTARQVRSKGAVAISDREVAIETEGKAASIVSSFPTGSSVYSHPSPRKSPVKAFFRNARESMLPSYHARAPEPYTARGNNSNNNESGNSRGLKSFSILKMKRSNPEPEDRSPILNISGPLNVNPQFAHLVKPDMAHHPSQRRPDGAF